MDAFFQQLKQRLPLALATLELFDFAFDEQLLEGIYQQHRGRCYTDCLTFSKLLSLVRDCLLQHAGSGHRLFMELERDDAEPVDESNFYRKLRNVPVAVSRALLRQCTARLMQLAALSSVLLPDCFEAFEAVVLDGKKIKNAAKRLAPTRGYSGKLLGAKALVAMNARSGLALAMSDSLDGEANDLPLVTELLPQVREVVTRPIVWLADRQFCNGKTLMQLSEREGDCFVVRVREGLSFQAESRLQLHDDQGREVIDEIGIFGKGAGALRLRRITLVRPDQPDNVQLLSNLLDVKRFDALDLLKLYRKRWGIEQMFQQVTETFALQHLIGCTPKAILFQFSFCLLMYNLIQVIKTYVAEDGAVAPAIVSTYGLFYDLKRELQAWAYLGDGSWTRAERDEKQMRQRLRDLLRHSWDAAAYTKASDKKPRQRKPPPKRLHGGHTSVQRLLEGKAKAKR
jgi:hypothetical protein